MSDKRVALLVIAGALTAVALKVVALFIGPPPGVI